MAEDSGNAPLRGVVFFSGEQNVAGTFYLVHRRGRYPYSDVVGSMTARTCEMRLAGNPPCFACSRTMSAFGAM